MTRKMKHFSAKIILDFVAFLAISGGCLIGLAVAKVRKNRNGMI